MSNIDQHPFEAAPSSRLEREWLIPSAVMTTLLGIAALALMPVAGYHQIPPYFSRFVSWTSWATFGAMIWLLVTVVRLQMAGVEHPTRHIKTWLLHKKARTAAAVAGMLLAGIDLLFFMWIKPEVTAVVPFWGDQLYADIDKAIFGTDPWRFFQGIDLTFHAWAYSFFWFVAIIGTLIWLFAQPSSKARSAALLNYFALWSIFGPIGQYFGSAAGPIFYQKIGLGDRFAELGANIPPVTNAVSGYLWTYHVNQTPAVGAGISAMPSLHIATVAWAYLVFRTHKSRLSPFAAMFALYIFALSVALGWHYAVDGLAGVLGAILFHWASKRYFDRSAKPAIAEEPAIATW